MDKKYPINFSQKAKSDLIDIWVYIFNKSSDPSFADEFCDNIEKLCFSTLSQSPEIGSKRWHFGEELRMKPVGGIHKNYNLYYRFQGKTVEIIHIIRPKQDKNNNL